MTAINAIVDWDDAYANRDHIPQAQNFIKKWSVQSRQFRENAEQNGFETEFDIPYGNLDREKFDLFMPDSIPHGLMVFVHGGYWMAFDKSDWSHLAGGALSKNWAVAIPSYSLCPQVKIAEITRQICTAIENAATKINGDIILVGHSAGGHLISRMACENSPLSDEVSRRIKRYISISGVHDLRPLLNLKLNDTLGLDMMQALDESPALLHPKSGIQIDCVAGASERPEFIRQNALLANIWTGLGASTNEIMVKDKHHFSIIEELHDLNQGWLTPVLI